MKTYTIVRLVRETYQSYGKNRKEALDNLGANGNPSSVKVVREVVKLNPKD